MDIRRITLALTFALKLGACGDDDYNARTTDHGEEAPRPDDESESSVGEDTQASDADASSEEETGASIPDSGWRPGDSCLTETLSGDYTIEYEDDRLGVGGYTSLGGTLRVSSAGLTDLSWLACLQEIEGDLQLTWNDELVDLDGLAALASVGGNLRIRQNAKLASLAALDGVSLGGGDVVLEANPSLESLAPLGGLQSVNGSLVISEMDGLETLDDLAALESVAGRLDLLENAALDDVSGLETLLVVAGPVRVRYNPALEQCSAQQLGDALVANGYTGELTLDNNLGECP